jgi:polar amino acid transport system permease protein
MIWDWDYAWKVLPVLLRASVVTFEATVLGFMLALVIGLAFSLMRRSRYPILSLPAGFVVEFIRSTPLLVQIYFLYFGLPRAGISLTPLMVGVIGLGLHFSSYISEVYRAGIDAVPRGQWEAAHVLNYSRAKTFFYVILPQAIPPIVPILGNYLILMFKDTTILASIAVLEMLQVARILGSQSYRYLEPITIVGLIFIIVSLFASAGVRLLERRLNGFSGSRRVRPRL